MVLVFVVGNIVVVKFVLMMFFIILLCGELVMLIFLFGVFNMLVDCNDFGDVLIVYLDVVKILFIGFMVIGKKVMVSVVWFFKCVNLEFGGNDFVIVLDDVDIVMIVL